jgi:Calx-beta domain
VKRRALVAVLALATLGAPASDALACLGGHLGGHLGVRWASFQEPIHDFSPVIFYHAVEPTATGSVPVTIVGSGDDCSNPPQPVVGTYQVTTPASITSRPATAGLDYTGIPPSTTGPLYGSHGPEPTRHTDSVPLLPDALPETVVEQAQATITSSTGRLDYPFDVPLYIVDDDGTDRVSFESSGPFERSETYGVISVPVFRAGPATGESTYQLSATPSGPSGPTAGDDYALTGNPVSFQAGERVELVSIQIFDDRKAEPPEELTLTLDDPGGTVLPEDPIEATVRILDSVGATGLESRLHHPRQGRTYRGSDYRIREIHIFTTPGVGPPVTGADFALRRNLRGGECAWWSGKRFRNGDCQNERWLQTGTYEPDFFFYRLREPDPSTGRIRNYSAFSRARNGSSEIEAFLERGRNANTFEVSAPKT